MAIENHAAHRAAAPRTVRCRVVTVSDTRTEETDRVGGAVASSLRGRATMPPRRPSCRTIRPARVRDALRAGIETPDVTSLSQADGYVEIPAGVDAVETGERVAVTLF